jgi:NADH-quinone oxidoreductase subunit C
MTDTPGPSGGAGGSAGEGAAGSGAGPTGGAGPSGGAGGSAGGAGGSAGEGAAGSGARQGAAVGAAQTAANVAPDEAPNSGTSPDGQNGGLANLHGCPLDPRPGAVVVHCNRGDYLPLMTALKEDGYDLPVGVTGVDYLTHPGRDLPAGIIGERFEVVVELVSLAHRRRMRVRCQVPAHDPVVPTLFDLWPGTEAHERETYDMFGIRFAGHPDPSRILMPEDWEGHPLRKDYDTGHIRVQFKEAPK